MPRYIARNAGAPGQFYFSPYQTAVDSFRQIQQGNVFLKRAAEFAFIVKGASHYEYFKMA
jgi:hypothetical protein